MNAFKITTDKSYSLHCPEKTQDRDLPPQTKWSGRDIVPAVCDNSFLIKINTSNTYQEMLDNVEISLLKFSVNGKEFYSIDGNDRDAMVANSFKGCADNGEMKISITAGSVIDIHTVERQFKNNFLRCINEGMLNFYTMHDCRGMIDPVSGKTFGELFGESVENPNPTCCQFTRFLKYSYTDDSEWSESIFELKKINQVDHLPLFSLIQIRLKGSFVHEFLHISSGVCLEKMGASSIVFAKVDHILERYEEYLHSKNLRLFEFIKRPEPLSSQSKKISEQLTTQCFLCEIL